MGARPTPWERPATPPPDLDELRWTAPEGCPDEAIVERTLLRALGRAPGDRALGLIAEATIAEQDGRWQLELRLTTGERPATRRIEAESCRELASAAVLVLAIAIDPEFSGSEISLVDEDAPSSDSPIPEPPVSTPPSVPPTEPPPARPLPSELEPQALPESPDGAVSRASDEAQPGPAAEPSAGGAGDGVEVELRLTAGPGLRLLPRPTAALELSLGLVGPRWRVELGATSWTPTRAELEPGRTARFLLGAATVRACGVPGVSTLRFPLCAGLDAGGMSGRGLEGFSTPQTARQPWLAARAGASLVWRIHPRVSGWLGAEALIPLLRPSFGTDETADLVQVPALGASVALGLAVRLIRPKDWAPSVL